jgi:hypothetical protein
MTLHPADTLAHPDMYARILVVGAASHDVRLAPEHSAFPTVHTSETLAPSACRCGVLHTVSEAWDVVVNIGRPDASIAGERTVTLAIVRDERDGVGLDCHWCAAPTDASFSKFAQELTGFLLDAFHGDRAPIGFDAHDIAVALGKPHRVQVAFSPHALRVEDATTALVAEAPDLSAGSEYLVLGLYAPRDTTLRTLGSAMESVQRHLHRDAGLVVACVNTDAGARAVLLR